MERRDIDLTSLDNGKLLEMYDADLGKATKTRELYIGIVTRLGECLGTRSLLCLESSDIMDLVRGRGWSSSYHHVIWSAAKSFVRWAQEFGLIDPSSHSSVLSHRESRVTFGIQGYIPLDRIGDVFRSAETVRARFVCAMFFGTGIRRGALSALCWRDFEFRGKRSRLIIGAGITKGGRGRTVGLARWVVEEVLRYLISFPTRPDWRDFVFPSRSNPSRHLHDETLYNDFKMAALRAGIEPDLCHPHAARHSFGISLLGKVDLARIMRTMGHTALATTQRYLDISDSDAESAVREGLPDPRK